MGSLDSISSGCGNSVGIWLLATSCFPKLSQQVFTLFPAGLCESLLSPCPPIFNSFSSYLGWEGGGLDCCVQAAVLCGAGWWRLRSFPGVNPENGAWVRPLSKCGSLGEERSPATLLAVGITPFYRASSWWASLECISEWRLHPWPGIGWWAHLQPLECSLKDLYWQCVGSTQGCCSRATFQSCGEDVLILQLALGWDHPSINCVGLILCLYVNICMNMAGCLPPQDSLLHWPVTWHLGVSWSNPSQQLILTQCSLIPVGWGRESEE